MKNKKLTKAETKEIEQIFNRGVIEGYKRSHDLIMKSACETCKTFLDDKAVKILRRMAGIVGSAGKRLKIESDLEEG